MPRTTLFVLQTFVEDDGVLIAEEPVECISRGDARVRAELLASKKAGVIAWAKSGDPDSGEWDDDPEILFRAGRTDVGE